MKLSIENIKVNGVLTGQIIPLLVAHAQSLSKRIEVLENAE